MTRVEQPVRLAIPAPCGWINANDRQHRMVKARLTRQWRDAAAWAAKAAKIPRFTSHVRIVAYVHKAHARTYDATNWAPTAKAAVDGLRDAGVLIEDSNRYVTGPDMRPGGRAASKPWLELHIEPVPPLDTPAMPARSIR